MISLVEMREPGLTLRLRDERGRWGWRGKIRGIYFQV